LVIREGFIKVYEEKMQEVVNFISQVDENTKTELDLAFLLLLTTREFHHNTFHHNYDLN
jgi:hypothetical protein